MELVTVLISKDRTFRKQRQKLTLIESSHTVRRFKTKLLKLLITIVRYPGLIAVLPESLSPRHCSYKLAVQVAVVLNNIRKLWVWIGEH